MNQDRRIRRLGRSQDDPAARARYAHELVRQGQWRLLSTADLLDQQLVSPERTALARRALEAVWAYCERIIRDTVGLLGDTLLARLASDYAAHVPQAPVGRTAIEAARRWADDPTEDNWLAAEDARDAAFDAGYAASAAGDYAGSGAALAAAYADGYTATAAEAAYHAAAAAADPAAEQAWQQDRLVRYLVAPDLPTPVPIRDAP